jgi:hypothetical protein
MSGLLQTSPNYVREREIASIPFEEWSAQYKTQGNGSWVIRRGG